MIRSCDRIIVIIEGFKIDTRTFGTRYNTRTGKAVNSIDSWLDGSEPRRKALPGIIDTLLEFIPQASHDDVRGAMSDAELEPWNLLRVCDVRYDAVRDRVSEDFRRLVKRGGMQVASIAQMTDFAMQKQTAIVNLFNRLQGRWTLYRCHSSQFGILRETFLMEPAKAPVATGTYYQYDDAKTSAGDGTLVYRELKMNLFFCGDVVTAIGANLYDDGNKLDPVVVTLLTDAVKTQINPFKNHIHLPGILLALADGGHMPAAMRVVARQDSRSPELVAGIGPVAIVDHVDENDLYGQAVDNSVPTTGSPLLHSHERLSDALKIGSQALERKRRPPRPPSEEEDGA